MKLRLERFAFIAMAVVVVACGGGGVSADQACTDVAQARCGQLQMCSAFLFQRRWPDLATCEVREKLACTNGLAAPKTAQSPSHVDSCATALDQEACTAVLSDTQQPASCEPPAGTGAIGAACAFNAQCASAFCAVTDGTLCGTCANEPAAGDSCATFTCGNNLVCVKATMQCQAPVEVGGSCGKGNPCDAGLACVGSTATTNGMCVAQVTTMGTACDPTRKTGSDCDPNAGLTCDTTLKQCVTAPTAAAGAACGLVGTTNSFCTGGAICVVATGMTSGTCVAPVAEGAACDTVVGPFCEVPAKCVTNGSGTAGTCGLEGTTTCS